MLEQPLREKDMKKCWLCGATEDIEGSLRDEIQKEIYYLCSKHFYIIWSALSELKRKDKI